MKHLNFILAGLFFLCGLCCRAQVLPLEENVVLNTKEGQIKGKLLLPGGVKTCPVVLIIAGSGPTDMDGNSAIGNLRNNSLKFLAEGLAANGIASLRFDKRGIGTSASAGKEESKLRFEDYVNDVTGWIDYLAKEKRFTTITVAGHSEGALIGMLACQNRPKVKGYISVAGAGRPAYEIIEAQVAAQQNPEAVRKEVASINGSLKNGKEVSDVPAYLQSLYRASVQPYLISWFKYNPRTVIASVKVPVLIVQGKNDIQVSVEDAEFLKKGCPAAELLLIDKMNHVLKDCEKLSALKLVTPKLMLNQRIAELSQLKKLDLSGNGLENIPNALYQLQHLNELDLGMNQLRNIPKGIGQLSKLKVLKLNSNWLYKVQLNNLMDELHQLQHLKTLHLWSCQSLKQLPENISACTALQALDVDNNLLKDVPESLYHMHWLKKLRLSTNPIAPATQQRLQDWATLHEIRLSIG